MPGAGGPFLRQVMGVRLFAKPIDVRAECALGDIAGPWASSGTEIVPAPGLRAPVRCKASAGMFTRPSVRTGPAGRRHYSRLRPPGICEGSP